MRPMIRHFNILTILMVQGLLHHSDVSTFLRSLLYSSVSSFYGAIIKAIFQALIQEFRRGFINHFILRVLFSGQFGRKTADNIKSSRKLTPGPHASVELLIELSALKGERKSGNVFKIPNRFLPLFPFKMDVFPSHVEVIEKF